MDKKEQERLEAIEKQYAEVLKNISDRIMKENLEAYKVLASENWGKK